MLGMKYTDTKYALFLRMKWPPSQKSSDKQCSWYEIFLNMQFWLNNDKIILNYIRFLL